MRPIQSATRAGLSSPSISTETLVRDNNSVGLRSLASASVKRPRTRRPDLTGEMTMTFTLRESEGGTEVELLHEGIPDVVPPEDNATGTRMALTKLAAYVEGAA